MDRQARPEQIIDDTFDGYSDVLVSVEDEIRDRLTVKLSHILGEEVFFPFQAIAAKKSKVRYTCPGCLTNVWGKPELNIYCGDCDSTMEEADN